MRREHPLRILRYSMKNLWLLIFPIVRGAYHFASREDIEEWLRGTWFELLILLAIFGYGFLNWYFRQFGIVKEQLYVRDGILMKRQRFLPIRNLSAGLAAAVRRGVPLCRCSRRSAGGNGHQAAHPAA